MTQIRTLIPRIRASRDGVVRLAQLVQSESIQNRSTLAPLHEACLALLHATLPRLSSDDDGLAIVKAKIKGNSPQVLAAIEAYQDSAKQKGTSSNTLDFATVERKRMRSLVALRHHMHLIENVLTSAQKTGISIPDSVFEEEPFPWLEHLNLLATKVRGQTLPEEVLRETRKVEMQTREGFPTILLHATRSLELYQRCLDESKEVSDALKTKEVKPVVDRKATLIDCVRYVDDAEALLEAIDPIMDVSALRPSTMAWKAAETKQSVLDFLLGTLRIWNTRLDEHELLLNKYLKLNPDVEDEALNRAVMAVRHGVRAAQDWLLSDNDNVSEPSSLLKTMEKADKDLETALDDHGPVLLRVD